MLDKTLKVRVEIFGWINYDLKSEFSNRLWIRLKGSGARWSSWINAAYGARGPQFASHILPTVHDLRQVVNLSLSVA